MSAAATMRLLGTAAGRASDRDRTRALLGCANRTQAGLIARDADLA